MVTCQYTYRRKGVFGLRLDGASLGEGGECYLLINEIYIIVECISSVETVHPARVKTSICY